MSDDTTQTPDLITQLRSCAAHVHHAEAQALLWTAADILAALERDRDDAHRAWKAAEAEVTRLRGRDNILAALERWYRADGRQDFPGAEAALLALCAEMFGEKNEKEAREP